MHLEQLEYFVAVSQNGSISGAAKELGVSQPAVSASIRQLENELGAALVKRGNRGVRLTSYGRKVYDEALQALGIISGMYAKHGAEALSGEVHVIAQPICSSHITRNIVLPFSRNYPGVRVFVHNVPAQSILATLKGDGANIAITMINLGQKVREEAAVLNWVITALFTDERRIFLGAEHPLAAKNELSAQDLKKLPIAYYSWAKDTVSHAYRAYFGKAYRLANRNDILDLVLRNEAAFIQAYHMFKHDHRMQKKLMVDKRIPISELDHNAPIVGVHTGGLSPVEQLFWNYLLINFTRNIYAPHDPSTE